MSSRTTIPAPESPEEKPTVNRIGVIGAGQLGQMLGLAGESMGLSFTFLDPAPEPPARTAGDVIACPFDRRDGLSRLAALTDIVTFEFENVPVDAVEALQQNTIVHPSADALRHAQDRLREKRLFESLSIPVAPYAAVDSVQDIRDAAARLGLPLVLKTRRLGYDGKGQAVLQADEDIEPACTRFGGTGLIAEQWVPFDREISVIGVRRANGEVGVYPLTENQHGEGILRVSRAPVDIGPPGRQACDSLERLMQHLEYVGVLAVEFFVSGDRLLANEFAPRVHNSGHWTIEGTITSQFENHLRAILDMPLGDTSAIGHAGMINLIGSIPDAARRLPGRSCFLHDYGKTPRPGRKLGHITVIADGPQERDEQLAALSDLLIG